ncbi:MAG TPA: phosphatase PAP2 family protein [Gemmatimonadaceae bacterium]|nr:phosphatase PAP2 family protein [Gemmatimonadaceae bacterium]
MNPVRSSLRHPWWSIAVAAALAASPRAARAQHADRTFFTRRDVVATGIALAGTALVFQFDERIARWTQQPSVQGTPSRRELAKDLTLINETPFTFGALATYGIGRLAHSGTTADVGLHLTESLVLTTAIGQVIRGALGRARPSSAVDGPTTHRFGRGYTDFEYRSFPSLHAATAFAASAAAVEEIRLRNPGAVRWAGPLLYGAASVPGFTRLYLNKHWASDIAAGSFLGAMLGIKTVRYAHSRPRTKLDRFMLGASVSPGPDGGARVSFAFK